MFTVGACANAGRATLMRISGTHLLVHHCPPCYSGVDWTAYASNTLHFSGQRIVARLRERTYAAALKQEVEFVERGEGDVISRLSVDSSIVGER